MNTTIALNPNLKANRLQKPTFQDEENYFIVFFFMCQFDNGTKSELAHHGRSACSARKRT